MTIKGVQPGKILSIAAGGAVASGSVQQVGSEFIGVALDAASASGVVYPLATEGVFTIGKKTSETWAIGDSLYWDSSASTASKTYVAGAADNFIGVATAVAASAATSGNCKLRGGAFVANAANVQAAGAVMDSELVAYTVTVASGGASVTTALATAGFTAGKFRWAAIQNNTTNTVGIAKVYDSGTDFVVELSGDPGVSNATVRVWSDER